mmetsp:Transcript_4373/g.10579  ORF Transcript_4373/g.10579 Transcript_4373/m.10579 type:complete len:470 (+) Transcript_4373:44-1453(+)
MSGSCKAVLVFLPGKQHCFDIPPLIRPLVLGRVGCDVELHGTYTSRQHAELIVTAGKFKIKDKSRYGIFCNGQRLPRGEEWEWQPGQVLRFGADPENKSAFVADDVADPRWDLVQLKLMDKPQSTSIKTVRSRGLMTGVAVSSVAPAKVTNHASSQPAKAQAIVNNRDAAVLLPNDNGLTEHPQPFIGPQLPFNASLISSTRSGSSSETLVYGPQRPHKCISRHSVNFPSPPPSHPQLPRPLVGQQGMGSASALDQMRGTKRPHTENSCKQSGSKKCDKCDGPHPTDSCPHFKKTRENHKDAWVNYGRKHPLSMGKGGGKVIVRNAYTVRQPGDGSCLFHSLCFGLNGGRQANGSGLRAEQLRRQLMAFIEQNPTLQISGDTLEEWIKWDSQASVIAYTRRMAVSGWGGGIEMAACSISHKVNVHVYESRGPSSFERISCFDCPEPTKRTIHVLYQGGMHFDAMVVRQS